MGVPKNMQQELDKRDALILALEMLTVDQACRQLALEAVVVNMAAVTKVKAARGVSCGIECYGEPLEMQ